MAAQSPCIRALGNRFWEVRNSATLCLTALVVRLLGFKNTGSRTASERGKRAVTGGGGGMTWVGG